LVIKANAQGWVNKKMLQEWIKEVWLSNIKKDMSYLLVWDSFSCHEDQELLLSLLEEHDTLVEIIPGSDALRRIFRGKFCGILFCRIFFGSAESFFGSAEPFFRSVESFFLLKNHFWLYRK